MLTSKGFGLGQAPTSADGELARYEVMRGIVLNGAKKPGDIVQLNPRSQSTIELSALGKIKRLADDEQIPLVESNRAVGIENGVEMPQKRGRKPKNG
jgi:hypothetical protein